MSEIIEFNTKDGEKIASIRFYSSYNKVDVSLYFGSREVNSATVWRERGLLRKIYDELAYTYGRNLPTSEEGWFRKHIKEHISFFSQLAKIQVQHYEWKSERDNLKRKTDEEKYEENKRIVKGIIQEVQP